jgi:dCMP deaminase
MDNKKINRYLKWARKISEESTCAHRHFGAVIVKDDTVISTGYNGTARGCLNCGVDIPCLKDVHNDPNNLQGKVGRNEISRYDNCPAVHAEQNAIFNAARMGVSLVGATMFCAEVNGRSEIPCPMCRRYIIQAGITDVYDGLPDNYRHYSVVPDFIEKENAWMKDKLENKKSQSEA